MSVGRFVESQIRRLDPKNRVGKIEAIWKNGSDPDLRRVEIAREPANDPNETLPIMFSLLLSARDVQERQLHKGVNVSWGLMGFSLKRERTD